MCAGEDSLENYVISLQYHDNSNFLFCLGGNVCLLTHKLSFQQGIDATESCNVLRGKSGNELDMTLDMHNQSSKGYFPNGKEPVTSG